MKATKFFPLPFLAVFMVVNMVSCSSTKKIKWNEKDTITLVFAGDIMAHTPNFANGDYDKIWRDIKPVVESADLSFANVEAPVNDNQPWSSYPKFNMHSNYIEAAINAGFNVFSLANNHTNDQGAEGIAATRRYFAAREGIWACGLKEKENGPLTYKLIETKAKDGSEWKVLFVAITELLNNNAENSTWIDYYPNNAARERLKETLKKIADENPHDIFVASIHTNEPEYVHEITENRKLFYKELLDLCNVDIVWANHPHIVKMWEKFPTKTVRKSDSFIMYANGNTISAQRTSPSFNSPDTERDYTGDGLVMRITAIREENTVKKIGAVTESTDGEEADDMETVRRVLFNTIEPFFITTYISPSRQYVIKFLNDDLIHSLDRADINEWPQYLRERKRIMERFLQPPKTTSNAK